MNNISRILLVAGLSAASVCPAHADVLFDVPSGRLGAAMVRFGEQANMSIGLTDPRLAARHTRGVSGRLDAYRALARLLAGTGAHFEVLDKDHVRVVGSSTVSAINRGSSRAVAIPAYEPELGGEADIVVAGSKQATPLSEFAGTVDKIDVQRTLVGQPPSKGTELIVRQIPSVSSTNLGPGRNKLFIRGIADSSFNGPTPATVAQYYGDVRLNYAAPDPNLNVYDVRSVEVLEGPQGTLYGSATVGGVIRLEPNRPVLGAWEASFMTGATQVEHGPVGLDAAAMVNAPLGPNMALRAVAYGAIDPGYIRDVRRNLPHVNRTGDLGGRIVLRYSPAPNWEIELGGIAQDLTARDGQYVERGLPPYSRSSAVRQPFDNDYRLAFASASIPLLGGKLSATTGFVHHNLDQTFDATPRFGKPARYDERIRIQLFTEEVRFVLGDPRAFNLVAGMNWLDNQTEIRRRLGALENLEPLLGVRNLNNELAIFGELGVPVVADLILTLGGRVNYDTARGDVLDERVPRAQQPATKQWRALPMVSLSWRPEARWFGYVRYQEGYRAGGLSVTGRATATKFRPDNIRTAEAGLRFGSQGIDPLVVNFTLSRARWRDIQADLIGPRGLPQTFNIGTGTIDSAELRSDWMPIKALTLSAALYLNDSRLDRPIPRFANAIDRRLPNVAPASGRISLAYQKAISRDWMFDLSGALTYIGPSLLGVGAPFDLPQGDYANADISVRIGKPGFGVSLGIENLANVRANRFAFGNPFALALSMRDEATPLRPRSIRIGFDGRF